jgi:hypothetical protein
MMLGGIIELGQRVAQRLAQDKRFRARVEQLSNGKVNT